jgi:hypothetical protein
MCLDGANDLAKGGLKMKNILESYYVMPEIVDYCSHVATQSNPGIDNTKKDLECGTFDANGAAEVNKKLSDKVNNAGYGTRAGVVAAARYLAIDFPYKVPFYASESGDRGRYYKTGINADAKNGWGCIINKEGIPTTEQVSGGYYPNGLDASAFVSWALLNGGVPKNDLTSNQLAQLSPNKIFYGSTDIGNVKLGDLSWSNGQIGLVIGIDNNNIYVAEEKGATYGLVVTTYPKTTLATDSYFISLGNTYTSDGNITNMW